MWKSVRIYKSSQFPKRRGFTRHPQKTESRFSSQGTVNMTQTHWKKSMSVTKKQDLTPLSPKITSPMMTLQKSRLSHGGLTQILFIQTGLTTLCIRVHRMTLRILNNTIKKKRAALPISRSTWISNRQMLLAKKCAISYTIKRSVPLHPFRVPTEFQTGKCCSRKNTQFPMR